MNANLCEKVRGPDVAAIRVLVGPIEQQPVELLLGLGREGVVEGEVDNLQRRRLGYRDLVPGLAHLRPLGQGHHHLLPAAVAVVGRGALVLVTPAQWS